MEFIQQEINIHKNKLLNLINNLINTQIVNNEIIINNDIKKETECLNSLLNVKQNILNNPINNNNINFYPNFVQPNINMNFPQMNINPMQIMQNNNYSLENNNSKNNGNNELINIKFKNINGCENMILCKTNETISDMINKYIKKASDYNNNDYIFNDKRLEPSSFLTLEEAGFRVGLLFKVTVSQRQYLNGT